MIKRPMTSEDFFNKISEILKEKGKLPKILDYELALQQPVPIRTYEFGFRNSLDFGDNEGIYLAIWIEFFEKNKLEKIYLGTFKTLQVNCEAMHIMAALLADFIIEANAYVIENLDDFTWKGADVHAFDDKGKMCLGYTCRNMESALKKKDELLEKYMQVVVRDNATRKELIYKKTSNECMENSSGKEYEAIEDILTEKISNDTVANIEDFLGYPITDGVLENLEDRIRAVLDQMPEDELLLYEKKYLAK